ncbi:MAG: hypothetical protein O3A95_10950 [Planctomycetota bacterium]|nr:hypothetical protein [Planctomycetota bacterium]
MRVGNVCAVTEGKADGTWWAVAYLGAGKTYSTQVLHERNRLEAWRIIKKEIGTEACKELKDSLKESVLSLTASGKKLQQLYSENDTSSISLHRADLMDRLRDCLEPFDPDVRKLMAVAAVCDVAKKTNPQAWRTHSGNVPVNDRKVQGALFNN